MSIRAMHLIGYIVKDLHILFNYNMICMKLSTKQLQFYVNITLTWSIQFLKTG